MDVLDYMFGGTNNGLIHLLLTVAVAFEAIVVGALGISPCLVKNNLHVFLCMCLDISHKLREIRLIGVVVAREMAGLLHAHIVPVFIGNGFGDVTIGSLLHHAVHADLTITI